MPKIHEMKESKFLKKEDVGTGLLLTVNGVGQENVAKQGADPEMKWVLHFEESDKPLVLNQINIQIAAQVFGSEDTDDWTGKRLVLYTDPNVSFGGKVVGGIRVRAPKKTAPAPKPRPEPIDIDEDSDIPFMWMLPILPALLAFHSILA